MISNSKMAKVFGWKLLQSIYSQYYFKEKAWISSYLLAI